MDTKSTHVGLLSQIDDVMMSLSTNILKIWRKPAVEASVCEPTQGQGEESSASSSVPYVSMLSGKNVATATSDGVLLIFE